MIRKLSPQLILSQITSTPSVQFLSQFLFEQQVKSTHSQLSQLSQTTDIHGAVLLATEQTEGRGCGDHQWLSPPGNLYCSIGWRFDAHVASQSKTMPLATLVAVTLAKTMNQQCFNTQPKVGLKWPNDLYAQGRKLGGVLCEWSASQQCVISFGINLCASSFNHVEQKISTISLDEIVAQDADFNQLVAVLIVSILTYLANPIQAILSANFEKLDQFHGAVVLNAQGQQIGVACGVLENGSLLIKNHKNEIFSSLTCRIAKFSEV